MKWPNQWEALIATLSAVISPVFSKLLSTDLLSLGADISGSFELMSLHTTPLPWLNLKTYNQETQSPMTTWCHEKTYFRNNIISKKQGKLHERNGYDASKPVSIAKYRAEPTLKTSCINLPETILSAGERNEKKKKKIKKTFFREEHHVVISACVCQLFPHNHRPWPLTSHTQNSLVNDNFFPEYEIGDSSLHDTWQFSKIAI